MYDGAGIVTLKSRPACCFKKAASCSVRRVRRRIFSPMTRPSVLMVGGGWLTLALTGEPPRQGGGNGLTLVLHLLEATLDALVQGHVEQPFALFPAEEEIFPGERDDLLSLGATNDAERVEAFLDALDLLFPELVHQEDAL